MKLHKIANNAKFASFEKTRIDMFEFFAFNTKLQDMSGMVNQRILRQQINDQQLGSKWGSLDQESNAYTSRIAWRVLLSLRLFGPYSQVLLIIGESLKFESEVVHCMRLSQFK